MNFIQNVFSKTKKMLEIYRFVFEEINKLGKFLLFILLSSALADGIIPIITKYVIKIMIFHIEHGSTLNSFLFVLGIYVFIIFSKNCLSIVKEYISSISILKFIYCIQNKIIQKIQKIEYKTFYSPAFQDRYSIVLQNSNSESSNLLFVTIQMLTLLVQFVAICFFMVKMNFVILIFQIFCSIPTLILNIKNEKKRIQVVSDNALSYRKNQYYFDLFTSVHTIKEIRIFNLKDFILKKKKDTFNNYINKWKIFAKTSVFKKSISEILPCLCMFFSILFSLLEVINQKSSISNFIFLVGMIVSFKETIDTLVSITSRNYRSVAFAGKLFDLLNDNCEINCGEKKPELAQNHTIEFKNVSFRYPNSENYAIKNINLKISEGEKIALVGQNGCGKTTLVKLILRLYDVSEGEILLDGVNIKQYDYDEYLKLFSTVFQNYQTYSLNLFEYVSCKEKITEEDLLKFKHIASYTNIDKLNFNNKSNWWNTTLTTRFDKNGMEFSGGQWQKLAVTRAFYSDSPILILDEPTSAMDAISESKIYENINKIEKHKIAIFISHRMYSSKIATKIVYMENGEIKNIDSHDKLMKISKGYKKIFEEQANKY